MPEQDPTEVTDEEVYEALTNDAFPFGVRLHVLREYHYQKTGHHLTMNLATSLILMANDQSTLTPEKLIRICSDTPLTATLQ